MFGLIAHLPGAVWLDGGHTDARSILSFEPVEVTGFGHDWPSVGREMARDAWVIGYLGYGAGHRVEDVPPEAPTAEPEIWLGRYEGVLIFEHRTHSWRVEGSPSFRTRALGLLARARPLGPPAPPTPVASVDTTHRERHEAGVRRIRALIGQGDCYQVNLTRPVIVRGAGDPWATYRRLRSESTPAYGAFLRLSERLAILSNSPELFLSVEGRDARSEPIKGTRPRHADPHRDHALAAELEASPKERAELTMIVDLVRNDLGRVAVPGTVHTEERAIVSHSKVHHAHRTVRCTLEEGEDIWSTLAATFPPGSVTGAPKVRACRRISEIEDGPRGVYCGAIGFVDPSGNGTWSVAIRTGVWDGDVGRFHVGGGIVWDSEPAAEWLETVHKAAAFAAATGIDAADRTGSEPERAPRRPR